MNFYLALGFGNGSMNPNALKRKKDVIKWSTFHPQCLLQLIANSQGRMERKMVVKHEIINWFKFSPPSTKNSLMRKAPFFSRVCFLSPTPLLSQVPPPPSHQCWAWEMIKYEKNVKENEKNVSNIMENYNENMPLNFSLNVFNTVPQVWNLHVLPPKKKPSRPKIHCPSKISSQPRIMFMWL